MTEKLKPIETTYNGYRFRSRLEARWAVFFDALGVKYEYEKEGYDLGEAGWYLPDFWLPQSEMWAEVKAVEYTPNDLQKCHVLAAKTHHMTLLLCGVPSDIPQTMIWRIPDELLNSAKEWANRENEWLYRVWGFFFGAEDIFMRWWRYRDIPQDRLHDTCIFDLIKETPYSYAFGVGDTVTRKDYQCIEAAERAVIAARSARFEFGEVG